MLARGHASVSAAAVLRMLKKILTERMQICGEITNQVFPLRGEDESFVFHRRQNRLFRGFQRLR